MTPSPDYTFWALAGRHVAAAAPVLAGWLAHADVTDPKAPSALRTLGCLDHQATVPALVAALEGPLRPHALLALEQVAVSPEMIVSNDARAALARAAGRLRAQAIDVEVLGALARARHPAAVGPLQALEADDLASAIRGLADVESPEALAALVRAAVDADDEIAASAVQGLMRARAAGLDVSLELLRTALAGLSQRDGDALRPLAARWSASVTG